MTVRVLHVIPEIAVKHGGPSRALVEIVRMLRGSPAQCFVMVGSVSPEDQPILDELRAVAAHVWSFPKPRFFPLAFNARFSCALPLVAGRFDVVHVHGMWNWVAHWALIVAACLGVPVVLRPAGALDIFDMRKHRFWKRLIGPILIRPFLFDPNRIQCTARREAANLADDYAACRRRILGLPVSLPRESDAAERDAARAALGIGRDDEVVLFLSRINYKKGLEILLPAVATLKASRPSLRFILAGDGEEQTKLDVQRALRDLKMESWTFCPGFVGGEEKRRVLAAADVMALPSMNENFGISLIEGLGAGLAITLSPEVYLADELPDSNCARAPLREKMAVSRAIAELLDERRRDVAAARRAARETATRIAAPDRLRPGYLELYHEVGGRRAVV